MAQKSQLQCPKGGIEISQEKKYHLHTTEQICPCAFSSLPVISSLVVTAISIGGTKVATFVLSIYQIQI